VLGTEPNHKERQAVREFLKDNTDSGEWEEVEWVFVIDLPGSKVWIADGPKQWPHDEEDRWQSIDKPGWCAHLRYRTSNNQGAMELHEALDVGDVATNGWFIAQNLDATNYIEIGVEVSSTFYGVIRIEPNEIVLCRLSQTTIYAKANTAACKLDYLLYED
jgi:hypothetical protein